MVTITDNTRHSSVITSKAFSLCRTNVRMSGNIKVVIADSDEAYIESINSSDYLNRSAFKNIKIKTCALQISF